MLILQTLCLRRGVGGQVGGTTPGKRVFGLRVVSVEDIMDLPDNKVRVIPASDIGIWKYVTLLFYLIFNLSYM